MNDYLTENELAVTRETLCGLDIAQKYTLMTEIQFLLAQNDAKITHLDVTGFRLLTQTLFGTQRRGRKQLMKNTQAMQHRMFEIVRYLDADLQQMKARLLNLAEAQREAFNEILYTNLLLISIIDRNSLSYPESLYQRVMQNIERAEAKMLRELEEVQRSRQAYLDAVNTYRVLRLIPGEMSVITHEGVCVMQAAGRNSDDTKAHRISAAEYAQAAALGEFDAVILPCGAPMNQIRARRRFDFNDYQVMQAVRKYNTTAGQQIVMLDYYNYVRYYSGYVITETGVRRVFSNQALDGFRRNRRTVRDLIADSFSAAGITPAAEHHHLKSYRVPNNDEYTEDRAAFVSFGYDDSVFLHDESFRAAVLTGR